MPLQHFDITDPTQLVSMALPVRAEIIDLVSGLGPVSCEEIASMLGKRRPAIHYQVNHLLRVGLLVPAGTRGSGRSQVDLVRTPARQMRLNFDAADTQTRANFERYAKLAMQRVTRLLQRAFSSGSAVVRGQRRNTLIAQSTCRLTQDQLAEVNRLIDVLVAEATPRKPRHEGAHYLLTVAIAPVEAPK
ncbi:MAG: helix-turn-helix domain-containing protein [Planctomycetota bacterium]